MSDDGPRLEDATAAHPEGVVLRVIVTPRSAVTTLGGLESSAVRVRVAAPPVAGAANRALTRYLADVAKVPRSTVCILSGGNGRRKVILFAGLAPASLVERLTNS